MFVRKHAWGVFPVASTLNFALQGLDRSSTGRGNQSSAATPTRQTRFPGEFAHSPTGEVRFEHGSKKCMLSTTTAFTNAYWLITFSQLSSLTAILDVYELVPDELTQSVISLAHFCLSTFIVMRRTLHA